MLDLELPTRHEWITADNTYGKLVIEPFEPGFALTVGNATAGCSCPPSTARRRRG
jgi:hypothetical protein